eukprot:CAMPEP_0182569294 /NCGR_PEP_ID=MMETSP1324-20130603/9966_1 /TAXON_ID=236786 /ORGANISM="Florenciella sp., Strain RCC1587" /LENGTH=109 /DNA_ID=CAMNT_0024783545 /DNA_START=559 /DNA_END=885 /DNA_ORIENTATION=-
MDNQLCDSPNRPHPSYLPVTTHSLTHLIVLLDSAYERAHVVWKAGERVADGEVGSRAMHQRMVGQACGAFQAPLTVAVLVLDLEEVQDLSQGLDGFFRHPFKLKDFHRV